MSTNSFVQPCKANESKMSPERLLNAAKPQSERRCLRCICTHDDLEKISESFVVCISRRAHCDSHKRQRKRDKWQTFLCSSSPSPLLLLERNLAAWLCVWTLPEPRSKSYGDKSPSDTQTPPFTTEGSLFLACLPYPLTTNAEHRAIFSHSAMKSIKAVIQGRKV